MIDDMALLKQAMEQMDAEDPAVAQTAKDRAAQILSDAKQNFSKMAELIEQRRLLLRPRIVAGIKRMDQPGMLGDAAFRDTGSALRKEGQSFGQIAEAIERTGRPSLQYEDLAQKSEPLHQMASEPLYEMASEPGTPAWLRALAFVVSIVFFPLLHPIRFLAIALLAILLFYAVNGFVSPGQQVLKYFDGIAAVRHSVDKAMSSVSSFVNEHILRQSKEATAPPTPSTTPSGDPATASAPPATAPAPSANAPAPPAPPSAAPAPPPAAPTGPRVSTPSRDARGKPPFKVGSEVWGGARGSLSLVSLLRTIRRRSPARFRGHYTRRDQPPFPHGGAVYRWRRRLLLGRWSILTFCRVNCRFWPATAGTNPGRGWLLLRRPRCPIASARFTIARTVTDGCSVAARMDVFSSYTKPTCLPAERRPKSRLETFSEGAKRAPSIKRLRA